MEDRKTRIKATLRCIGLLVLTCCLLPAVAGAQKPNANGAPAERHLHGLARDLALALGDTSARTWLEEALATSPYVEDRIAFNRVIRAEPGVRAALFEKDGGKPRWSGKALTVLPDLELYFPIRRHRETWSSERPVEVAAPLSGTEGFLVYSADGRSRRVDADFQPVVPTLLLARSEIDFDDLPSAVKGGRRTASYLRERTPDPLSLSIQDDPSSIYTKGIDATRNSYLTYLIVTVNYDSGFRGAMEIEVFGSINGSYKGCTRITGVQVEEPLYLDPPNPSSPHRIATAIPTAMTVLDVDVYEDDEAPCVKNNSDENIGSVSIKLSEFEEIWGVSNGDAAVRVHASSNQCGDNTCEGPESCSNCSADCGLCPYCGDGTCNGSETCTTCPGDNCCNCNFNGYCEPGSENEDNCPTDCCGAAIFCGF